MEWVGGGGMWGGWVGGGGGLPPLPTHPPLRFTREQTRVEYIRRCRLKSEKSIHFDGSVMKALNHRKCHSALEQKSNLCTMFCKK